MFEKVREALGHPATAEDDVEPDPAVSPHPGDRWRARR